MDPHKTILCNGCLIGQLQETFGEESVVVRQLEDRVRIFVAGLGPPDEGEPVDDEDPTLKFMFEMGCPDHCGDGYCLQWQERHGEAGMAWHAATETGMLQAAYRLSTMHYVNKRRRPRAKKVQKGRKVKSRRR